MIALVLFISAADAVEAAQHAVNPSASAEKAFTDRVNAYLDLHRKCEATIGPLPKTADPAAITRRQRALGDAIRAGRVDAKRGDIFTPDVASLIRRLIAADLAQRKPVERQAFVVSQPDIPVHLNDFYPTTVPLATVPPQMLEALPRLPKGLQYRFVGSSLILFDVDPNLIVDILPDAVPSAYRKQ